MRADVLFPYATLETDPTLSLSAPTVDGAPAALLAAEGRVDLSDAPTGWKEARLNVRAQVPVEELDSLGVGAYNVVLTLACGPTNLRSTAVLTRSGGAESSQWTGAVSIPSTMIRDRATLYVTVTGTIDGVPNRWLGASRPVVVDLHPPRIPEITGGQVPVIWRDFTKTDDGQNPIDASLHDEQSYVDMSLPEGPVIYLNERVSGLRRLLDERTGRSHAERAIRELALDLVAAPCIIAMTNVALAASSPSDDRSEVQWPSLDWQRGVLETVLPLMYPDRDSEAALTTATRGQSSSEEAAEIQSRIASAASRLVKATQHVRGVIRHLEEDD
jgi:hypothetical protein